MGVTVREYGVQMPHHIGKESDIHLYESNFSCLPEISTPLLPACIYDSRPFKVYNFSPDTSDTSVASVQMLYLNC